MVTPRRDLVSSSFHCAAHPLTGWNLLPFSRQGNRSPRGSRRGLAECASFDKLPPKAGLGGASEASLNRGWSLGGGDLSVRTAPMGGRPLQSPQVPGGGAQSPELHPSQSRACGDTMTCTGLLTVCLIRPPSPRPPVPVAGPSGHALFQDVSGEQSGRQPSGPGDYQSRRSYPCLSLSLTPAPHPVCVSLNCFSPCPSVSLPLGLFGAQSVSHFLSCLFPCPFISLPL